LGQDDRRAAEEIAAARDRIVGQLEKVIVGQKPVIEELLIALFSRGHCLLVGVPGLAKTLLISTLASVLDLTFNRVQFTPDLMPSDITGTDILEEDVTTGHRTFVFLNGPIFTNVLLADEINRTPPKTQAALLEVMEEKTVTIDGVSHPLSDVFTVVATQNPIEYEGTYRLPEAQLDRFLLKLEIAYPPPEEEDRILRLYQGRAGLGHPLDILGPPQPLVSAPEPPAGAEAPPEADGWGGVGRAQILRAREETGRVAAKPEVCAYIGRVVRQTRELDKVLMGASSRAAVHLLQAAKVRALMSGRPFVTPDDVKRVCRPVLRHRVTLQPDAYVEGFTPDDILTTVLERVEVPR
jgi:MoxR-like ATPase